MLSCRMKRYFSYLIFEQSLYSRNLNAYIHCTLVYSLLVLHDALIVLNIRNVVLSCVEHGVAYECES